VLKTLAEKFIHQVRDQALTDARHHFAGTWAVAQNNEIHAELISKLGDHEKDLLWRLLTEAVESTLGFAIRFADHKDVTGEMRITIRDPATGEEAGLFDDKGIDLSNEYWFEWLEKYSQVRARPADRPKRG
jgi:hypothetical protein